MGVTACANAICCLACADRRAPAAAAFVFLAVASLWLWLWLWWVWWRFLVEILGDFRIYAADELRCCCKGESQAFDARRSTLGRWSDSLSQDPIPGTA